MSAVCIIHGVLYWHGSCDSWANPEFYITTKRIKHGLYSSLFHKELPKLNMLKQIARATSTCFIVFLHGFGLPGMFFFRTLVTAGSPTPKTSLWRAWVWKCSFPGRGCWSDPSRLCGSNKTPMVRHECDCELGTNIADCDAFSWFIIRDHNLKFIYKYIYIYINIVFMSMCASVCVCVYVMSELQITPTMPKKKDSRVSVSFWNYPQSRCG